MALYFGDFPIKMVVFTLAGDLVHTYNYNLLKWPTLSKSAFTVLSVKITSVVVIKPQHTS